MADHDHPTPQPQQVGVDRRKLLQISVQACGFAAAASGSYVVLNYMAPLAEGLGEQDVAIQESELKPGTALQVLHKGKPVLIVRDSSGGLHALSAICTHLGCLVKWSEEQSKIECPCHGAQFALDGKVLGGPAPEALAEIPVGVENGVIRLGGPS
jgi:cytochrome b6-f complex iron-sulfur subunit